MPLRLGDGTGIQSVRLGDGTEIQEIRKGDGTVLWSALPAGAVARWRFEDEADTSTAIDSWGSYDATIKGGASYTTTAYEGSHAMDFGGVDGNLVLNNQPVPASGGDFTIGAWIRGPSGEDFNRVMSNYDGTGKFFNLALRDSDNAAFSINDGSSSYRVVGSTTVLDSSWHHVVGVRDSGSVYLYVDGSSDGNTSGNDGAGVGSGQTQYISHPSSQVWNGQIDDARVYDTALTATQVNNWYSTGSIDG